MSWDNVTGIKNIKIWTDANDSTQGHLFVNDQHRLALNVGIAFNLNSKNPVGPTEDEVKSALSLINNQDSGPLKYLQIAEENRYTAVYEPEGTLTPSDNTTDGIYDYHFTYTVASPTSINRECYCEGVALKLEYSVTDSSGNTTQKVIETSRSGTGSSVKTYVTVICYPAKLYGISGQNRTGIGVEKVAFDSDDYSRYDANYSHKDDCFYHCYPKIDDPYFKILYYDEGKEPVNDVDLEPFYIHRTYFSTMWDGITNAFFPSVKCGEFTFDVFIYVRHAPGSDYIIKEKITIHQEEGQISFITFYSDVEHLHNSSDLDDNIRLRIYDQFGNAAYVVIYSVHDDLTIRSVS